MTVWWKKKHTTNCLWLRQSFCIYLKYANYINSILSVKSSEDQFGYYILVNESFYYYNYNLKMFFSFLAWVQKK